RGAVLGIGEGDQIAVTGAVADDADLAPVIGDEGVQHPDTGELHPAHVDHESSLPARALLGWGPSWPPRQRALTASRPSGHPCWYGATTTSTRWNSFRSEYPVVAIDRRRAPIRLTRPSGFDDGPNS